MAETFTIFPAIDLRRGRVVRLEQGDPARQIAFHDDPAAVAQAWITAGAAWLHVVNLDGALDESGLLNWQVLPEIAQLDASVQFGGGIRSLKDAARAFHRGVARVVLGTAALEDPELVAELVERFGPERVAVSIDAHEGMARSHGWSEETAVTPEDLGLEMNALGVRTVIYTDIDRDGVYGGVNLEATARLAEATGLEVIASGGVGSLDDVRRLRALTGLGVVGVIIGRALYEGRIDLAEAIAVAGGD